MTTCSATEVDYQKALLLRVAVVFPNHKFFRRNVGLVSMADGRRFRAGVKGQCDLYVIGRGGSHWELELKKFGRLSPAQETWRKFCHEWSVPWICLEVHKGELEPETIERWTDELMTWLTGASQVRVPA